MVKRTKSEVMKFEIAKRVCKQGLFRDRSEFSMKSPLVIRFRVSFLSEHEIRKRTDPDLLASIPGPELQLEEVQKLWGQTARNSSDNVPFEFDDLFMKHKADIGRCTKARHPFEVEPADIPHREGAR